MERKWNFSRDIDLYEMKEKVGELTTYCNFIGEWILTPKDAPFWQEILFQFHVDCSAKLTSGIKVLSENKQYFTIHVLIILSKSAKGTFFRGTKIDWPGFYQPYTPKEAAKIKFQQICENNNSSPITFKDEADKTKIFLQRSSQSYKMKILIPVAILRIDNDLPNEKLCLCYQISVRGKWFFDYVPFETHEYFICHCSRCGDPYTTICAMIPKAYSAEKIRDLICENLKGRMIEYGLSGSELDFIKTLITMNDCEKYKMVENEHIGHNHYIMSSRRSAKKALPEALQEFLPPESLI